MQTKKCKTCLISKELYMFSKAKSCIDGYNYNCKKCIALRNSNYYKTEKGLISKIYSGLKLKSKGRNHPNPSFNKEELKEWLYQNNFTLLYKNWVNSNYVTNLIPSVDRLNSTLPYTLDNIRLVTWKVNNTAAYSERLQGSRLTRQNRPVKQLTKEGVLIKEYPSIAKAARDTGFCRTNINYCLKGKRKLAHGFKWEYGKSLVKNVPTPRDK